MFHYLSKMTGLRFNSSKNTTNDSLPTTKVPDIESTDPNVHRGTNHAPNTQPAGTEAESSPSGTFVRITSGLLEVNQQVASFIISSKEDVQKDKRFLSLVNSYLESSSETLDLCTSLESCVQRAKVSMLIIWYAVKLFERDQVEIESQETVEGNKCMRLLEDLRGFMAFGGNPFDEEFLKLFRLVYQQHGENKHKRVLEELKKSKATRESPFDEQFFQVFASVYQQQKELLQKLLYQQRELEKKLKKIKTWKRVSNIVFAFGFFSVPVLTAVVMVVSVASAVEVLIGAFSATVGSIGKWCSYSWNKRERPVAEQKSRIQSIKFSTYLMLRDMDNIHVLVRKLDVVIESLMVTAEFTLGEEDAVEFGMDEIRRSLDVSLRSVEDVAQHTSRCSNDVTKTRNIVSEKILKQPSDSASKRRNWLEIFM